MVKLIKKLFLGLSVVCYMPSIAQASMPAIPAVHIHAGSKDSFIKTIVFGGLAVTGILYLYNKFSVNGKLKAIKNELGEFREETDKNFKDVKSELKYVKEDLARIEGRIIAIDKRIGHLQSQILAHREEACRMHFSLKNRLDNLDKGQALMHKQLDLLIQMQISKDSSHAESELTALQAERENLTKQKEELLIQSETLSRPVTPKGVVKAHNLRYHTPRAEKTKKK